MRREGEGQSGDGVEAFITRGIVLPNCPFWGWVDMRLLSTALGQFRKPP